MFEYKGYQGVCEFDIDGEIYTGEILGIRSVITFQGRTLPEAEKSMRDSIVLYLEACKEYGENPEIPSYDVQQQPE